MKFRTKFGILTIIIIGLFIYAVYLSYELEKSKSHLQTTISQLQATKTSLKAKSDALFKTNDSLQNTMKELNVWTTSDQNKRKKQERLKNYKLGIEVRGNNENYQNLIAYVVGTGFDLDYINQRRGPLSQSPRIYYYSEKTRPIALELRNDLERKFPNLKKIKDSDIMLGRDNKPSNVLTAKLKLN